jgi:hypothetical protein
MSPPGHASRETREAPIARLLSHAGTAAYWRRPRRTTASGNGQSLDWSPENGALVRTAGRPRPRTHRRQCRVLVATARRSEPLRGPTQRFREGIAPRPMEAGVPCGDSRTRDTCARSSSGRSRGHTSVVWCVDNDLQARVKSRAIDNHLVALAFCTRKQGRHCTTATLQNQTTPDPRGAQGMPLRNVRLMPGAHRQPVRDRARIDRNARDPRGTPSACSR